jgi:hypothetical protein
MKTFLLLTSDQDGEPFLIEAEDIHQAREEALKELGWYVVESDPEDEEL